MFDELFFVVKHIDASMWRNWVGAFFCCSFCYIVIATYTEAAAAIAFVRGWLECVCFFYVFFKSIHKIIMQSQWKNTAENMPSQLNRVHKKKTVLYSFGRFIFSKMARFEWNWEKKQHKHTRVYKIEVHLQKHSVSVSVSVYVLVNSTYDKDRVFNTFSLVRSYTATIFEVFETCNEFHEYDA